MIQTAFLNSDPAQQYVLKIDIFMEIVQHLCCMQAYHPAQSLVFDEITIQMSGSS
jgi:hypothetical protein